MASSPFQPATFNPFHAAGPPGPSTNPFPQMQTQPQPTGFLQPQFTAMPGVAQQPTNPFPGFQTTSPVPLQTQMTGVNPFRASTLPMQPTGLSPFAPTNPTLSSPTGSNPFSSQNGFLATDPYATTTINSGANPFPITGQTTGAFPVVGNVNPFTAQRNNLGPNATGPNPFSSASSNPFPTMSQTAPQPFSFASPNQPASPNILNTTMPTLPSTFALPGPVSVPTRPASTPLAQTKPSPSSPFPMPVKSHQTGSRNPFGVPRAPSPPPLPRAPTLFELANNTTQPQPQQSQSPVQVKPQATGLPTTTFASVASSFLTGGTGGAQAPQFTASPPTNSFGSPTMDTFTPTSLAATTSTGSTSSNPLFSSFGGQSTGSTFLSSQPTGAPLRPQTTGFTAGVKAFKPTSSFGASLLEALPPIPQSEPSTPALDGASTATTSPSFGTTGITGVGAPAGVGLGANLGSASSPTIGFGTGTSGTGLGRFDLAAQPTGFSPTGAGMGTGTGTGGPMAFGGGSSLGVGVGLHPQATGLGLGAANPFRASMLPQGVGGGGGTGAGAGAGAFPAFNPTNASASTGLFLQPTGATPSFGQSLFMGPQTEASKQQNGAAQLI